MPDHFARERPAQGASTRPDGYETDPLPDKLPQCGLRERRVCAPTSPSSVSPPRGRLPRVQAAAVVGKPTALPPWAAGVGCLEPWMRAHTDTREIYVTDCQPPIDPCQPLGPPTISPNIAAVLTSALQIVQTCLRYLFLAVATLGGDDHSACGCDKDQALCRNAWNLCTGGHTRG